MIKRLLLFQCILIAIIGCAQKIKMNNTENKSIQKGKIRGAIINLPDGKNLEIIQWTLTPELFFSQTLDSLGNFVSKEITFGTYTLRVFHDDTHYPILIKNFRLNDEVVDLGNLPLFKDPFGYQEEWGQLADDKGSPFHYYHPVHDAKRDSLETSYLSLFKKSFPDKKLIFKTIDISTDSTDNTIEEWRFSMISHKY
jgi:hypothetical protein